VNTWYADRLAVSGSQSIKNADLPVTDVLPFKSLCESQRLGGFASILCANGLNSVACDAARITQPGVLVQTKLRKVRPE